MRLPETCRSVYFEDMVYYILYPLLWVMARMPMGVLYVLSDCLYPIVRYVVRYRYGVVRRNVENAFPDWDEGRRGALVNRFYRHLCDYFVESVALMGMGEGEIRRRFVFTNPEFFSREEFAGRNFVAVFGHYGNWEWVSSLPLWVDTINVATLYKPLRDRHFDRMFLRLRSRFGTICIDKNKVLREMVRLRREPRPYAVAFIADQTPSVHNIHYWTKFLNQESAVLTGWETIAKKTGDAVIFLDVRRVRRGYYEAELSLISADAKSEPEYAMSERYIRLMERSIMRDPAYWLWSHNRWKHKKE